MTTSSPISLYREMSAPELRMALRNLSTDAPDFDDHLNAINQRIHEFQTLLNTIRSEQKKGSLSMSTSIVYGPRQFRLYIAGSRKSTNTMLQKARQAVERAHAQGWAVFVGDNPEGVDAAVIATCNKLQVNYVCFGIAAKPRVKDYRSVKDNGTGHYMRVETEQPYDYAKRDRYMAELADRGLFIWNADSKGTRTAYEYMKTLGKSVDLLTFNASARPVPAPKPSSPKSAVIEVIIDTSAAEESMTGTLGLRALDVNGGVLHQVRETFHNIDAHTADYAKLQTLIQALNRLKAKTNGDAVSYTLKIVQSSKNVEGWLSRGWKRNMEMVQQLAGAADALLTAFPTVEWKKASRPQVLSLLAEIK